MSDFFKHSFSSSLLTIKSHFFELFSNHKNWSGVLVNKYCYNPQKIINNNKDIRNKKVAIILYDKLDKLLKTYENIKYGDITTDNINKIGFISVKDCKKIINIIN